jgi:Kef-type K+ transport system membrane component KefB
MDHAASPITWAALALMILAAKLGGELALRLRQPPVLGELIAGVLLGNLPLPGLMGGASGPAIGFAAELGVMLLLFEVGLGSSVREMLAVAPRAGLVALIGVIVPSVLGAFVSRLVLRDAGLAVHMFVGATLCATSVGITASVLKDLGALDSREARVILGAAVIDDVLGLIILSVVSAVATTGVVEPLAIGRVTLIAVAFVVGALAIGVGVTRGVYRFAAVLHGPHVLGAVSVALCLALGSTSAFAGLAPIVGAYAAGLLLDEVSVRPFGEDGIKRVEEFVSPIAAVFAPIFFVRTGMSVQLGGLDLESGLLIVLLVLVAFLGKLVCGIGVRGKDVDRLTIGLGMTPRGEVGLIFAGVAANLEVGGKPLLSRGVHAALIATVFITTVVAPPALAWRMRAFRRETTPNRETGAEG